MGIGPYDEGLIAATSGMAEEDNPYADGTEAHNEWLRGFADGVESSEGDDNA